MVVQLRSVINSLSRENTKLRQQLHNEARKNRPMPLRERRTDVCQMIQHQIEVANLMVQIQSMTLELKMCRLDEDMCYAKLHDTLAECTAIEASMVEQRKKSNSEIKRLEENLTRMEVNFKEHQKQERLLFVELQRERISRKMVEEQRDDLTNKLNVQAEEHYRIDKMYKCVVCMDADRAVVTMCGHIACCSSCYAQLKFHESYPGNCPLCRHPFGNRDFEVKFG